LPPVVLNTLRQLKLASPFRGDSDLVFPAKDGRAIGHNNLIFQGWQPAQVAAGVVTPDGKAKYPGIHSARHFYASWLINAVPEGCGLSAKAAMTRLGHSSVNILYDVYGHLFEREDETEQMKNAERALLG
jgi:integrase